jgi:hypothetical protein
LSVRGVLTNNAVAEAFGLIADYRPLSELMRAQAIASCRHEQLFG